MKETGTLYHRPGKGRHVCHGPVLIWVIVDIVLQKGGNKQSVIRVLCRMMEYQGRSSRRMVTDELNSNAGAHRELISTGVQGARVWAYDGQVNCGRFSSMVPGNFLLGQRRVQRDHPSDSAPSRSLVPCSYQ